MDTTGVTVLGRGGTTGIEVLDFDSWRKEKEILTKTKDQSLSIPTA